jgi:hypothetical protein
MCEQEHSQTENSTDVKTSASTATVEFRLRRTNEFCLGQEQWKQKSELPNASTEIQVPWDTSRVD